MAATTAGALKAKIESLGLGISAYRDQPPAGQAKPYVSIQESIAMTPDSLEDGHLTTGAELVQVEVYETLGAEDYALLQGITAGLHGARLASIGTKLVYAALVRNVIRDVDLQNTQIRHIIDVDVLREL
jgi:hypothetical protein